MYAVGTAPGIAKTESNPLMLGVSDDGGITWRDVELPVDTNADRDCDTHRNLDADSNSDRAHPDARFQR